MCPPFRLGFTSFSCVLGQSPDNCHDLPETIVCRRCDGGALGRLMPTALGENWHMAALPSIRSAKPADVSALLTFWREDAKGVSISDDDEGVLGLLRHDPECLLVAEVDGMIVGSVIAGWDGWRAHLYRLAVANSHRRQGVGTALLAAAEARFRRLGARRIDAMVRSDNPDAHAAWAAAGFSRQADWRRWIKPLAGA